MISLTDQQRRNWLRLIRTPNVGPATFWRLINTFGSASNALEALPTLFQRAGKPAMLSPSLPEIEREIKAAGRAKAHLVARGEEGYPRFLTHLDNPPPLLYVKGDLKLAQRNAVAMVGSRNGSALGQKFTRQLARDFVRDDYVVVSGLARGIDAAAHRAALDGGTIAVIAGGIDNYYPPQNRELQCAIEQTGLVVSERLPGFQPRAQDFPRRNRIIAGSALGTLVVEAGLRSGSLITARLATEMGRHVMAVPGHPLDPRAAGANKLIRNGATMITSARDVIEQLAPMTGRAPEPPLTLFEEAEHHLEADPLEIEPTARESILTALGPNAVESDELARCTGRTAREVQVILLELELEGLVLFEGGQSVRLAPR